MKTIHKCKNTISIECLVFLFLVLCLAMQACKWGEPCKLTDDDKAFLYEDGTKVKFLENGKDTIELTVKTTYGVFDESSAIGLPDISKEETGSSSFIFYNNNYRLGIHKIACSNYLRFSLYLLSNNKNELCFSDNILIDSLIDEKIIVLGNVYIEYYLITDSSDNKTIKDFYYSKEFGVIKLCLLDGYTLELIP